MIQILVGWQNVAELVKDFEITLIELEPYDVLLGYYSYENYSGEAFVLLRHRTTNVLYEVNASHCSCMGLEGQFDKEKTTVQALTYRMNKGKLGESWNGPGFTGELWSVIQYLDIVDQGLTNEEIMDELIKLRGKVEVSNKQCNQAMEMVNELLSAIRHDGSYEIQYNKTRNEYASLLRKIGS